jgi:hypothetical protein
MYSSVTLWWPWASVREEDKSGRKDKNTLDISSRRRGDDGTAIDLMGSSNPFITIIFIKVISCRTFTITPLDLQLTAAALIWL